MPSLHPAPRGRPPPSTAPQTWPSSDAPTWEARGGSRSPTYTLSCAVGRLDGTYRGSWPSWRKSAPASSAGRRVSGHPWCCAVSSSKVSSDAVYSWLGTCQRPSNSHAPRWASAACSSLLLACVGRALSPHATGPPACKYPPRRGATPGGARLCTRQKRIEGPRLPGVVLVAVARILALVMCRLSEQAGSAGAEAKRHRPKDPHAPGAPRPGCRGAALPAPAQGERLLSRQQPALCHRLARAAPARQRVWACKRAGRAGGSQGLRSARRTSAPLTRSNELVVSTLLMAYVWSLVQSTASP